MLELIQAYFGVGKIYKHGTNSLELRVSSLNDLKIVINHFENYPLITQKLADYKLFKQGVELIQNKEHLTKNGLLKLINLKASLNLGLSENLKLNFSDFIPVERPLVENTKIQDINWLIGFVEAEGCFHVVIQEYKDKPTNISLKFTLTQHSRDRVLLESFINYLGCGRCYKDPKRNEVQFIISTFLDIYQNFIPLFKKYPLLGDKQQNFLDFYKVAELIKSKNHLTKDGLEKIKLIKNNMNTKRK